MSAGRSSTFVAKSGNALYFEESGSHGLPVLCLHGIGGGAWFFSGFAQRLTEGYRIVACDLPGTGRSGSSKNAPTLDSIVADLADFIARHVGEPAMLLGHSLGTILSLKLRERHPEAVRAMLFVCGLPKVRPEIHEKLSARADAITRDGIAGWGPKVSPGVFSSHAMRELPETVALFEQLFETQEPATYVRSIEILLAADMNAVVPTVDVPCAAIIGAEDLYAPPDNVRAFTARLPGDCDEVVLQGCAHMPFLEDPAAFARAAETLIKTLEAR